MFFAAAIVSLLQKILWPREAEGLLRGATPLGFEPRITHQTPVEALSRGKITLSCFAFSDDYSFGILQSGIHWSWFIATNSKLKGDFRYTPESVFDTFPWPQKPKHEDIKAVAEAAVTLRALQQETMRKLNYSLPPRAIFRLMFSV